MGIVWNEKECMREKNGLEGCAYHGNRSGT